MTFALPDFLVQVMAEVLNQLVAFVAVVVCKRYFQEFLQNKFACVRHYAKYHLLKASDILIQLLGFAKSLCLSLRRKLSATNEEGLRHSEL